MASTVEKVVSGNSCIGLSVAEARFRPIRATMVPMTTGGISAWIQPVPDFWTTRPTMNSAAPETTMPPSAPAMP